MGLGERTGLFGDSNIEMSEPAKLLIDCPSSTSNPSCLATTMWGHYTGQNECAIIRLMLDPFAFLLVVDTFLESV